MIGLELLGAQSWGEHVGVSSAAAGRAKKAGQRAMDAAKKLAKRAPRFSASVAKAGQRAYNLDAIKAKRVIPLAETPQVTLVAPVFTHVPGISRVATPSRASTMTRLATPTPSRAATMTARAAAVAPTATRMTAVAPTSTSTRTTTAARSGSRMTAHVGQDDPTDAQADTYTALANASADLAEFLVLPLEDYVQKLPPELPLGVQISNLSSMLQMSYGSMIDNALSGASPITDATKEMIAKLNSVAGADENNPDPAGIYDLMNQADTYIQEHGRYQSEGSRAARIAAVATTLVRPEAEAPLPGAPPPVAPDAAAAAPLPPGGGIAPGGGGGFGGGGGGGADTGAPADAAPPEAGGAEEEEAPPEEQPGAALVDPQYLADEGGEDEGYADEGAPSDEGYAEEEYAEGGDEDVASDDDILSSGLDSSVLGRGGGGHGGGHHGGHHHGGGRGGRRGGGGFGWGPGWWGGGPWYEGDYYELTEDPDELADRIAHKVAQKEWAAHGHYVGKGGGGGHHGGHHHGGHHHRGGGGPYFYGGPYYDSGLELLDTVDYYDDEVTAEDIANAVAARLRAKKRGLTVVGAYDIQQSRRQMDSLKSVTVGIANALVKRGTQVANETIKLAEGGLFQRTLPGVTSLKSTLGHLQWHADKLRGLSDRTAIYDSGDDLKKWAMQAWIDANSVEEGRGRQEELWGALWDDIGTELANLPAKIVKAVGAIPGQVFEAVTGIPAWIFWAGGAAVVVLLGVGIWKLAAAAAPAAGRIAEKVATKRLGG